MGKQLRVDLYEVVGGSPTTVQQLIIEQCILLRIRIALLDRELLETGRLSPHDDDRYLSWVNVLTKLVTSLAEANAPPVRRQKSNKLDSILHGQHIVAGGRTER